MTPKPTHGETTIMEGRVLKFFFSPRTPGVVEFSCQFGPMHHFANVEVEHGDILEYDEDGTPVTAWSKYSAPDGILQEAGRQDETRTAERLREIEEDLKNPPVSA